MTLIEIENLSATELKERRAELETEAAKGDAAELAKRFVQARFDAKSRDEKLSEQGATITSLNAAVSASVEKTTEAQAEVASLKAQLKKANESATAVKSEVEKFVAAMKETEARAVAAERLAKSRRVALADVMKTISPVLAAE